MKSMAYSLTFQNPEDSLTDEEVARYMEKIQASPIVNEFFTKQQQLSIYLADLEKIIFEPIQDLYK